MYSLGGVGGKVWVASCKEQGARRKEKGERRKEKGERVIA